MALPNRVYGGFDKLPDGMNGGLDASLLPPTQAAAARNLTFRGGLAAVRPPFTGLPLRFPDAATQSNFAGLFQGAMFYDGGSANVHSGLLVSLSGRLFFIDLDNGYLVRDVTPKVAVVTAQSFTVPAINNSVTVNINEVFTLPNTALQIGGGNYTLTGLSGDTLTLTYTGGMPTTVPASAPVLDSYRNQTGLSITAQFTIPAINSTVNASFSAVTNLIVNNLTVQHGTYYYGAYTIVADSISGSTVQLTYAGKAVPASSQATNSTHTAFTPNTTVAYPFVLPNQGSNVTVQFNTTSALSATTVVYLQSLKFTVSSVTDGTHAVLTFNGAVGLAGEAVLINGVASGVTVSAQFNLPAVNSNVTVTVTDTSAMAVSQVITIDSYTFTVSSVTDGTHVVLTYTGYQTQAANGGNVVSTSGQNLTTLAAAFTIPAVNGTVQVTLASTVPVSTYSLYINNGYYLISAISGTTVTLTFQGFIIPVGTPVQDNSGAALYELEANPASYDFVYGFQAEQFAILCAAPARNIIYDGSSGRPANVSEIPPMVFGLYNWGRIWAVQQDGKTFVASDLVGGPSGTYAYNYKDAVLKMTENTYLAGGGSFTSPTGARTLTGLARLATQDTSLGVGNLLVGSTNGVFSVNTPVDRTQWQNTSYPIQTVGLDGYGPVGPRNGENVNGDWWFRSLDGYRSYVVARRDINVWGNTPASFEIDNLIAKDDPNLLFYGSMMQFDNKLFATLSPLRTPQGVVHQGLAVINFDLISSLWNKERPAWEGVTTGLQIYQLVRSPLGNNERAFAFARNPVTTALELWEFETSGYYDTQNTGVAVNRAPVQAFLETRRMGFRASFENSGSEDAVTYLKKLITAELWIDQLVDTVSVSVLYRPDQDPTWYPWETIQFCANVSQCGAPPGCGVFMQQNPQYAAKKMLAAPAEVFSPLSQRYAHQAYEFQFRLVISGHCRLRKFKVHAAPISDTQEGALTNTVTCNTVQVCPINWFDDDIHDWFYNNPPTYPAGWNVTNSNSTGLMLAPIIEGVGAPTAPPNSPGVPWFYVDTSTGIIYYWNVALQQWK